MKLQALLLLVVWSILPNAPTSNAQTTLSPGDLAVIAHNNDNTDQIVLAALSPIASGTVIYITDNAWTGTSLSNVEGTWTYTFPSNVNAGARISLVPTSAGVVSSGTWDLSTSGDQIFIYQGSAANPTFIYGFSSRAWVTGSTSLNTSRLPSSLLNGKTARDFSSEVDNGYYNATNTSGTKDFILTQIGTTTKWSRSNNRYASFPNIIITLASAGGEPTAQPTNFNTSSLLTWSFNVNWSVSNPYCDGYLVLRADHNNPVNGAPVDGVTYNIGDQIGNAKVSYIGAANSYNQKGGVIASSTYQFAVFAYNGSGSSRNFLQSNPLTGTVSTPSSGEGAYYANISTTSPTFVSDLQNRIRNPYTVVDYALFDETIVTNFSFTDTSLGRKIATCVYSGEKVVYTPPFAWIPNTPFSREHTWCHSWMPSSASTTTQEYADQHHLFVVNQNNANAVRSNHPLGEVVNVTSSYLQGTYGTDVNGHSVYEPRESHKGNAARALLYMSLRYNGIGGQNWTFNHLNSVVLPALNEDPQDVQQLLQWHLADPPDAEEISRNDYVQSIQGNRNPFVDHPSWVDFINFADLSYVFRNANNNPRVNENSQPLNVFPSPFNDKLKVSFASSSEQVIDISLLNVQGVCVYKQSYVLSNGLNEFQIDALELPNGMYILVGQTSEQVHTARIIKTNRP